MTISGKKRRDNATDNANFKMRERSFGHVTRRLPLPFNADEAHITSKLENGVLAIDVPKADSHQHSIKSITIQ